MVCMSVSDCLVLHKGSPYPAPQGGQRLTLNLHSPDTVAEWTGAIPAANTVVSVHRKGDLVSERLCFP